MYTPVNKISIFQCVWVRRYFVGNFKGFLWKATFEFPHNNISPIHGNIYDLYKAEIWRDLGLIAYKKWLDLHTENKKKIILWIHIDGLVQERRNSTANALELRLSCTYPSICTVHWLNVVWWCHMVTKIGHCLYRLCMNQNWLIDNLDLGNKLQWKWNQYNFYLTHRLIV